MNVSPTAQAARPLCDEHSCLFVKSGVECPALAWAAAAAAAGAGAAAEAAVAGMAA